MVTRDVMEPTVNQAFQAQQENRLKTVNLVIQDSKDSKVKLVIMVSIQKDSKENMEHLDV